MKDHRLIDERSLAFHELIARKVMANPALLDWTRANLQRWLRASSPHQHPAFREWSAAIEGPRSELLFLLTSTAERAVQLRQSSPFAGLLSSAERAEIIHRFHQRESAAT